MENFLNILFNMPFDFQIGSAVALIFLVLSWLLLLLHRITEMLYALAISWVACVAFCRLPMVPDWGHFGGTFVVYSLIFTYQAFLVLHDIDPFMIKRQRQKDRELYSSDYEAVAVDPSEFTWLNLDYYDTKQCELASLGFQKIGDYECLPYTKSYPETRFFTRKFNNIHYDVMADVSQICAVKPKNVFEGILNHQIVTFITEFSDGTFLNTSNILGINPLQDVEGIVLRKFPPDISLKTLLDTHEEEVEKICEIKNLMVGLHRNVEELQAAGKREFILFCKNYQKKYGFTLEENTQYFTTAQKINNDYPTETCLPEYNKQA
jgi:hypothetical protein